MSGSQDIPHTLKIGFDSDIPHLHDYLQHHISKRPADVLLLVFIERRKFGLDGLAW